VVGPQNHSASASPCASCARRARNRRSSSSVRSIGEERGRPDDDHVIRNVSRSRLRSELPHAPRYRIMLPSRWPGIAEAVDRLDHVPRRCRAHAEAGRERRRCAVEVAALSHTCSSSSSRANTRPDRRPGLSSLYCDRRRCVGALLIRDVVRESIALYRPTLMPRSDRLRPARAALGGGDSRARSRAADLAQRRTACHVVRRADRAE